MYILNFFRASWTDVAVLTPVKQIQLLPQLREQGIDQNRPYCTGLNMKNK